MTRRSDDWKERLFENTGQGDPLPVGECVRLAEIGDLHFESSSFATALDYYRQLLDRETLVSLDLPEAVRILRKSIDCALNSGDLRVARELLDLATDFMEDEETAQHPDHGHLAATIQGRFSCLLTQRSQYQESLRVAKHAFAVLALTDDHREVGNLQVTMGVCHHRLGRLSKAEEFYSDALATFRRIGDKIGMSVLYNNLALLHKNTCRWRRALEFQDKALAIVASHGDTHLLARMYLNRGIILRKAEKPGEAREALEKSLRLAGSLGDRDRQTKASLALGILELESGNQVRAEELILEGQQLAEHCGFLREATIADEYMGDILLQRGEHQKALYNYGLGLEKTRIIGRISDLEGELLRRSAQAYQSAGDHAKALSAAQAAVSVCMSCNEDYELGFCHMILGASGIAMGDADQGDHDFRTAIEIFKRQDLPLHRAKAVLAYHDAVRGTATQAQLVTLRRNLVECTSSTAVRGNDRILFRLYFSLAEVHADLDQLDEALLTLSELERIAVGLDDGKIRDDVLRLQEKLETDLCTGIVEDPARSKAIASLSGLLREGVSPGSGLRGVLMAALQKTGADLGVLAITHGGSKQFVAEGVEDEPARKMAAVFRKRIMAMDRPQPVVLNKPADTSGDAIFKSRPFSDFDSWLCLPIEAHGSLYGLLLLAGNSGVGEILPTFHRSLEFLDTLLGLLALGLPDPDTTASTSVSNESGHVQIDGIHFENIITANESMLDTLRLVSKVAPSELTVLLQGETGTGKGLLAQAIHDLSPRSSRKFMSINCAAMPEHLLESELFGHVKGSFTGAYNDNPGLLNSAEGGSIFLDEIGKLPLNMQGKLLHFLDTKVVRPVGSNRENKVDVRIICATKGELKDMVERGEFLEDLYYRLLDFPIRIPPLRDRIDDIQILAPYFLQRYAERNDVELPGMTSGFMASIKSFSWPGNVRELEKTLSRAIVLANGETMLQPSHLPARIRIETGDGDDSSTTPLKKTIADVEAREIAFTLKQTNGNKSRASRLLGISYPNMLKKIKLYGLDQS